MNNVEVVSMNNVELASMNNVVLTSMNNVVLTSMNKVELTSMNKVELTNMNNVELTSMNNVELAIMNDVELASMNDVHPNRPLLTIYEQAPVTICEIFTCIAQIKRILSIFGLFVHKLNLYHISRLFPRSQAMVTISIP